MEIPIHYNSPLMNNFDYFKKNFNLWLTLYRDTKKWLTNFPSRKRKSLISRKPFRMPTSTRIVNWTLRNGVQNSNRE